MRLFFLFILTFISPNFFAQNPDDFEVFQFYSSEGKKLSVNQVVEIMSESDVVLFGELHDHALIHWLQFKIAQLLSNRTALTLGGEFFELDNQTLIDEYTAGLIPEEKFEADARLWKNYKTDYAAILRLARDSGYRFIATNIPRRYASFVARYGLDSLKAFPEASSRYLPPLPVPFSMETPGYSEMIEMMGGMGHQSGMNPENFVKAQAIKDYTMALMILKNLSGDKVFYHINGDFHSANYGGIYWYIKELSERIDIITVKIQEAESALNFDENWKNSGDLILVVPADFTRTH